MESHSPTSVSGFLKAHYGFFLPLVFFIIGAALLILAFPSRELHLIFNLFHFPFLDASMPYLTWLGDGIFISALCLVLLFLKKWLGIFCICANLLASGIAQILKNFVFGETLRPFAFFEGGQGLHLIPGVEMFSYFSFPSGHTTLAFATAFCLSLAAKKQVFKTLLLTLALFTGYTRIYLNQHFFEDVFAGAMVGTVTAMAVYFLLLKTRWRTHFLSLQP